LVVLGKLFLDSLIKKLTINISSQSIATAFTKDNRTNDY